VRAARLDEHPATNRAAGGSIPPAHATVLAVRLDEYRPPKAETVGSSPTEDASSPSSEGLGRS